MVYVHSRNTSYPVPVTVGSAVPGQFVEERARRHLVDITGIGSRPVGSLENEVKAVDFLLGVISDIKRHANPVHHLEVDVKRVSGSFSIDFLGEFTSVYDNVNNIAVKLSPGKDAEHSLLINCHYDTVFNTSGASDDAVSCCIMLEVLRVLSAADQPFQHNVIFLFNGAEENILQASHGFITAHPWAKQIKAFINLEAAGAGGKELLFQAGPGNPWLISMYAKHAPHPFASILGQEIFESGIIPSDTDYRIYRDFGGLPGIDIAYIANGYVYHTKFDSPEMIPAGCIQRGGDNLLALVKAVSNSPLLADPGEYRHGRLVFFDVVGHFMVVYPTRIGLIVNTLTCVAVLLRLGFRIIGKGSGFHGVVYVKNLVLAVACMLFTWLAVALTVVAVGFSLDSLGHPMSWYTNTWLLFGLYVAPSLMAMITTVLLTKKVFYKNLPDMWPVERVYFDAVLLIFTLALGLMTWNNVDSAVVMLICILFPLVMRGGFMTVMKVSPERDQRAFLLIHYSGLVFPTLILIYAFYMCFLTFIPIMGRAGTKTIPDLFVGAIIAAAVILVFSYQISVIYVFKELKKTLLCLTLIFVVSGCLTFFTPFGFPFSANESNPTKQRMIIHHVDRKIHDVTGRMIEQQSGIMHIPFDRVGLSYLKSIPELGLNNATLLSCDELPYCGWPYYFPMIAEIRTIYLKPCPSFKATPPVELTIVKKEQIKTNQFRIVLSITGPNHINIYLSPKSNVHVTEWSIASHLPMETDMPPGTKRPHYFIFYSYGKKPDAPLQISFLLEMDSNWSDNGGGLLDIALGAHYLTIDGKNAMTPELHDYVSTLPDWAIPMAWVATYEAWII